MMKIQALNKDYMSYYKIIMLIIIRVKAFYIVVLILNSFDNRFFYSKIIWFGLKWETWIFVYSFFENKFISPELWEVLSEWDAWM